jgi:hypothetical protein
VKDGCRTHMIASAQNTLYLPQFVDGSQGGSAGWITAIALTNPVAPGTPAATGPITLMGQNGTPLGLTLYDENGNSLSPGARPSLRPSLPTCRCSCRLYTARDCA